MTPEDQESSAVAEAEASSILTVTKDVCEHFRIKWVPVRVAWAEVYRSGDMTIPRKFPQFRDVPTHHPVMFWDTLYLPPEMIGRLRPEEWRPIVASSMTYYAKLATRKDIGIITRITPLLLLVGAGLYALLLAGAEFGDFVLLLSLGYLGVTMVGLFFLINPYLRGLWFKADRIAADYVGPLTMLGVLEKIQGFHVTELEGGRFSDKPSLAKRIAKLRDYWSKTSGLTGC